MKKLLAVALLILVTVVMVGAASALTAEEPEHFWYSTNEDMTAVYISGLNGTYYYADVVSIPSEINGIPVTSISSRAFQDRTSITEVIIPYGISDIGSSAFSGCTNIKKLSFPSSAKLSGNDCFDKCSSITDVVLTGDGQFSYMVYKPWYYSKKSINTVTIEEGITSIGSYLFDGCSALREVTFPESVSYIFDYAFQGCSSIESLEFPKSMLTISSHAFSGCSSLQELTLPEYLANLESYAFSSCTSLQSVRLPEPLATIGSYAFSSCTSLTSLTLPDTLTSIGSYAFRKCESLTNVIIPNSVKTIESSAFADCTGIHELVIGEGVSFIDSLAFSGCAGIEKLTIPAGAELYWNNQQPDKHCFFNSSSIKEVTISGNGKVKGDNYRGLAWAKSVSSLTTVTVCSGVTELPSYAFYNFSNLANVTLGDTMTVVSASSFENCSSLTKIELPDTLTCIEQYAFSGCSGLEEILIPESVTLINCGAFSGCEMLTEMVFPQEISEISATVLYGCKMLKSFTIPSNVTRIGAQAFEYCESLTEIFIPENVISIDSLAFCCCTGFTEILIPDSVTSIGEGVFSGCSSITKVSIPAGLNTNIGSSIIRELTITGTTSCDYEMYSSVPWQNSKESITTVNVCNGVQRIGNRLFQGLKNVSNIVLPNSVTSIGSYSFDGCTSLTKMIIPNSVTDIGDYAFRGCIGIVELSISDSISRLGSYPFWECTSVDKLSIPAQLCSQNFYPCFNVRELSITGSGVLEVVSYGAAWSSSTLEKLTIHPGVTGIADNAFSRCENLTEVSLAETITSIGSAAFQGCTNLQDIRLPSAIQVINDSTFSGCSSLSRSPITDSITQIGNSAFSSCESLSAVSLPNSLRSIGNSAFYGCPLTEIEIPDSVTSIGSSAFSSANIKSVFLPNHITDYGRYSSGDYVYYNSPFGYKTKIYIRMGTETANAVAASGEGFYDGYFYIHSRITDGGIRAFTLESFDSVVDTSLETLIIPEGVTSIAVYSITNNFPNIKGILIPISVNSIQDGALFGWFSDFSQYTVYCYMDSYADTWATRNGYNVVYLDGIDWQKLQMSAPEEIRMDIDTPQYFDRSIRSNIGLPGDYDPVNMVYESSDESILTIDKSSKMTANNLGTVTVTARLAQYPSISVQTTVHVLRLPKSISLPQEIMFPVKSTYPIPQSMITYTPEDAEALLTWSTENSDMATVDANGVVTGVSMGTTTLTVTTENGCVAQTTLRMIPRITSVTLKGPEGEASAELWPYETYQLIATVRNNTTTYTNEFVAFSSSDESVATVDDTGLVQTFSGGTAVITARTSPTVYAQFTVTVRPYDTFRLPEQLKVLEAESLMNTAAQCIILPKGLQFISQNAFAGCDELVLLVNNSDIEISPAYMGLPDNVRIVTP